MDYHDYVFDKREGKYLGLFEDMYRDCEAFGIDPWHQDDISNLPCQLLQLMLSRQSPSTQIFDFGCGKGSLWQEMLHFRSRVVGLDISPTAISVARDRIPEATFLVLDCQDVLAVRNLLSSPPPPEEARLSLASSNKFCARFALISETLSYIPNYQEFLHIVQSYCSHGIIKLFLPRSHAYAYVKKIEDVISCLDKLPANHVTFEYADGQTHLIEWSS